MTRNNEDIIARLIDAATNATDGSIKTAIAILLSSKRKDNKTSPAVIAAHSSSRD